jgi:hypothetical protein
MSYHLSFLLPSWLYHGLNYLHIYSHYTVVANDHRCSGWGVGVYGFGGVGHLTVDISVPPIGFAGVAAVVVVVVVAGFAAVIVVVAVVVAAAVIVVVAVVVAAAVAVSSAVV